jgi:hypothetical protein
VLWGRISPLRKLAAEIRQNPAKQTIAQANNVFTKKPDQPRRPVLKKENKEL